jgi:hypothetical protein
VFDLLTLCVSDLLFGCDLMWRLPCPALPCAARRSSIAQSRSIPAIVHTAAASQLGKMLVRMAPHYGVQPICVVRKPEHVAELKALGAKYVFNSTYATARAAAAIHIPHSFLCFCVCQFVVTPHSLLTSKRPALT